MLFLSLNLLRDCRLHREEYNRSAVVMSYVGMSGCVLVTAINLLASGLDPGLASLAARPVPDIHGMSDSISALAGPDTPATATLVNGTAFGTAFATASTAITTLH